MIEVIMFIFNSVITLIINGFGWIKELFLPTVNILPELIKGIFPFLGVEDVIKSTVLLGFILLLASAVGLYVSIKNRKKIWTFACGVVEIFSAINLLSSR